MQSQKGFDRTLTIKRLISEIRKIAVATTTAVDVAAPKKEPLKPYENCLMTTNVH